jgi:hypothetical protein
VVEGGLDHVPEHKHCTVHTRIFPLYRTRCLDTVPPKKCPTSFIFFDAVFHRKRY